MSNKTDVIPTEVIEKQIFMIRGQKVILEFEITDCDLHLLLHTNGFGV